MIREQSYKVKIKIKAKKYYEKWTDLKKIGKLESYTLIKKNKYKYI